MISAVPVRYVRVDRFADMSLREAAGLQGGDLQDS